MASSRRFHGEVLRLSKILDLLHFRGDLVDLYPSDVWGGKFSAEVGWIYSTCHWLESTLKKQCLYRNDTIRHVYIYNTRYCIHVEVSKGMGVPPVIIHFSRVSPCFSFTIQLLGYSHLWNPHVSTAPGFDFLLLMVDGRSQHLKTQLEVGPRKREGFSFFIGISHINGNIIGICSGIYIYNKNKNNNLVIIVIYVHIYT